MGDYSEDDVEFNLLIIDMIFNTNEYRHLNQ